MHLLFTCYMYREEWHPATVVVIIISNLKKEHIIIYIYIHKCIKLGRIEKNISRTPLQANSEPTVWCTRELIAFVYLQLKSRMRTSNTARVHMCTWWKGKYNSKNLKLSMKNMIDGFPACLLVKCHEIFDIDIYLKLSIRINNWHV